MNSRVIQRRRVYQVLALVLVATWTNCLMAQTNTVEFFSSALQGRVLEWTPPGLEKIALLQPTVLAISATPSGDLQLGFSHQGYTGASGSPQSASLLAVFDTQQAAITQDERTALESGGFTLWSPQMQVSSLTMDLVLPADPVEEARLRALAKLPKTFTPGTLQMINLSWVNVGGKVLYDWLTGPNGLRLTIRALVPVRFDTTSEGEVVADRFDTWWALKVGAKNKRLIWNEGEVALAYELLRSGSFMNKVHSSPLSLTSSSAISLNALATQILKVATHDATGALSIAHNDLMKVSMGATEQLSFVLSIPVHSGVAPGVALTAHPEYVTDQSGNGIGLEALLQKH